MNKTTIVVALVAGLAGGVISRYISPAPVLAQQAQAAPAELRAQRFALVNPEGAVVATFAVDQPRFDPSSPSTPSIRLLDSNGKEIWSAGGNPMRKLAVK